MKSLFASILLFSLTSAAAPCKYGSLLGFDDATELVARVKRVAEKTYEQRQAPFVKGVRAVQIQKAFQEKSVKAAFEGVDEGNIFKFEIPGNPHTPYDSLTVIFAHRGDTLAGAIFVDDSSVVAARLSDGDILICEPGLF